MQKQTHTEQDRKRQDAVAEVHRRNREQTVTDAELALLVEVRGVCAGGFGEVTVIVHEGRISRLVRSESIKLTA